MINDDSVPTPPERTTVRATPADAKAPPLLEVGPLGWLHKNLFSSWWDSLLTIILIVVVISLIWSFVTWSTQQADWFVVIFNLRLLMVGRYPTESDGRVIALTAIGAFTVAIALAAWARLSRRVIIGIVVLIVFLFVAPAVFDTITPSPSNVAAGTKEIAYSAAKETPQPQVGFIAKAGETITVRMADQYSVNDQTLSGVYSFSDKASNLLANAATDRLSIIDDIASINSQLSSDLLTAGQRARLKTQVAKLSAPDSITDTYTVNTGRVKIRILKGATLDPLVSGIVRAGSAPVQFTIPADGWYVLEKLPASDSDQSISLLQTTGIEPLLARANGLSAEGDSDTPVGGQAFDYIRVSDNFTTEQTRPVNSDGNNLPMLTLIDNGYRGNHTLGDFLRLYAGAFFDAIKWLMLVLAIIAALGYVAGIVVDRVLSPAEMPRKYSRRAATWLFIAFPVIMFGLIYGVGNVLPLTDTRRWGGLLLTVMLTIVSVIASFPLGILLALGRRSSLPVISVASTIYIEFVRGVPLITVLFMGQLLLPLVNPALVDMPNVFRAMVAITLFNAAYLAENVRGGLQAVPHGQQEAAKALGMSSLQITTDIMLPQALRAVFPALVGMVIAVFKDTSLVTIVGLLDLTGIGQNVVTQTEFVGERREVLLFITVVYFIISYAIASVSRRIEKSGAGAIMLRRI